MLRKTVNILLVIVFAISTTGFTISKHYCGNFIVDFSINSEAETCSDMDGSCCHTESEHYQVEQDFVNSNFVSDIQLQEIDILFPIYFLEVNLVSIDESEN